MDNNFDTYEPDTAVPPGWLLEEHLEVKGFSQAEFARRCDISPKHVSEIISGQAPISPITAVKFEKVLGMKAYIWLGIEAKYRIHIEKEKEMSTLEDHIEWAKGFPLPLLRRIGAVKDKRVCARTVYELLNLFNVANVTSWHGKVSHQKTALSFKKQDSFNISNKSLSVWMLISDNLAQEQACATYSEDLFKESLEKIKCMTNWPAPKFWKEMVSLCNQSGVALCLLENIPKLPVSGTAKWLTKDKAVITLSLRFGTNDHFWFSFFHEAAHILFHKKNATYVDIKNKSDNTLKEEKEANDWAGSFLIPQKKYEEFINKKITTKASIIEFAKQIDIHPGIVVGRLHHDKILSYRFHNNLKRKFSLTL